LAIGASNRGFLFGLFRPSCYTHQDATLAVDFMGPVLVLGTAFSAGKKSPEERSK